MSMKSNFLKVWMVLSCVAIFASCNDDDDNSNGGTTRMEVRLTDAPAPYDEVNIDIRSISINASNDEDSGWQALTLLNPGVYNLLDFQNGVDTLLAGQDVPAGMISQIRLVLGENNTVVKDGASYPLSTPSAQQSGLKLSIHGELIAGIPYKLWIDFDATRSIVETGSGKYQLKPVIRTYTEATGGAIDGTVLPVEANAAVWAILGTDSILAYPETNGYYRLSGLEGATGWKVVFDVADTSAYKDAELTGITVKVGEVTSLETTMLEAK